VHSDAALGRVLDPTRAAIVQSVTTGIAHPKSSSHRHAMLDNLNFVFHHAS